MKAMIFAAGLGTRLKPFTIHHPKALVPLGGVPMLERVVLKLKAAGVTEFVVNVHHFADQIIDFLKSNDDFGCKIHISDERSLLLDTGGGILAAKRWLAHDNEPFIVHNADIFTDFDIRDMVDCHLRSHSDATLLVAPRDTSRYLLFDDDDDMRGWTNVSTGKVRPEGIDPSSLRHLAFGGVHILEPKIFGPLSDFGEPSTPFSIIDFYIDYCSSLVIKGFTPTAQYYWHDIGKPQSLAAAEEQLKMA